MGGNAYYFEKIGCKKCGKKKKKKSCLKKDECASRAHIKKKKKSGQKTEMHVFCFISSLFFVREKKEASFYKINTKRERRHTFLVICLLGGFFLVILCK